MNVISGFIFISLSEQMSVRCLMTPQRTSMELVFNKKKDLATRQSVFPTLCGYRQRFTLKYVCIKWLKATFESKILCKIWCCHNHSIQKKLI